MYTLSLTSYGVLCQASTIYFMAVLVTSSSNQVAWNKSSLFTEDTKVKHTNITTI